MNENFKINGVSPDKKSEKPEENILAGIVGAFLFSLVGGILWFVLYQFGYLAAISGIIAVICAIKGYSFFSKNESIKGIVISVIIAIAVMVLAWYLCLSYDIFTAHAEWYEAGVIDYKLTFPESFYDGIDYLKDPEIAPAYYKDLAIGVLLSVVGCIQPIISATRKVKASNEPQETVSKTEE